MKLKRLQLNGFKSFAHKSEFIFDKPITSIVGPNGSGKSNVVESIRFVLGEQSMKSLRGGSTTDLIFKGSNAGAKQVNKASVSLTFDNSDRIFSMRTLDDQKISLDFDEIIITRDVYRDGRTNYQVNGNDVRLKDIMELIASVNIGASGHHIISQGEADRLLNANTRERRGMLEDALGLKMYQYRIRESERKLERTLDNVGESQSLRREIGPHLRFLKRQVEKIERARGIRQELTSSSVVFFAEYEAFLDARKVYIGNEHSETESQLFDIKQQLSEINATQKRDILREELETKITLFSQQERDLQQSHEGLTRRIGRLEGMIEIAQSQKDEAEESVAPEPLLASPTDRIIRISKTQLEGFWGEMYVLLDKLKASDSVDSISDISGKLLTVWNSFKKKYLDIYDEVKVVKKTVQQKPKPRISLEELSKEYAELSQELNGIIRTQQSLTVNKSETSKALQVRFEETRESDRQLFALKSQLQTLDNQLNSQAFQIREVEGLQARLATDVTEYGAILGEEVTNYKTHENVTSLDQSLFLFDISQTDLLSVSQSFDTRMRSLERMKIKLEEIGGGSGADVVKEYEETRERDEFLAREISDLENSTSALKQVIRDLKKQLSLEFEHGVAKINTAFNEFFTLMFGGGKARLSVAEIVKRTRKNKNTDLELEQEDIENEEEKQDKEYGVDINVQLPRKRVQSLQMLSGGERSLTSIALLFALSQVNPPPFLVLDETDAALDEANSQKYGDMIEKLSKLSQLIVVTHNRETMSRANILYGVTIGTDGASQLLSVKFDEATAFAK